VLSGARQPGGLKVKEGKEIVVCVFSLCYYSETDSVSTLMIILEALHWQGYRGVFLPEQNPFKGILVSERHERNK
jgi:hypothetical protein